MPVAVVAMVAVFLAFQGVALAVHDLGLFQLDYTLSPQQGAANVSHTNISPTGNTGDDWDNVYKSATGNGPGPKSNAFANAFIADPTQGADTSYFTGGGSKDNNDIPQWQYGVGSNTTPDKDDLNDIFAAAYKPTSGSHAGHTLFYFGADRFATSGDSQIGFWFFRQKVGLGANGAFTGQHDVGDILILTDMVNGGAIGDIKVYKWVGGQAGVQLLLSQSAADCALAGANDTVCGVINNIAGETPPWPYLDKAGDSQYNVGALFEGGFDVNDLLDVPDIGCFSSFLGETRSSQSVDATLKDFALGQFAVCGVEVSKTGDTLSKIGDPAHYTVTINNTGDAVLYLQTISDTLLGSIAANGVVSNQYLVTNTCGASLAANDGLPGGPDECTMTFARTVQAGDPDPLPNRVFITYNDKQNLNGDQFTDDASWTVNLFQPAVSIAKTGDDLSKVGDSVTYHFTITNMSSQDSPNLTLASISDNVLGDLMTQATAAGCGTLAYQGTCTFGVTRTTQAGDADPLVNTVSVLYHPVGFPNNITASDSHSVNLFQPSVSIDKTGNSLSKIGDSVTYHFKITNTSSTDSPNLLLQSITDDVLGDLSSYATAANCNTLAPAASCEFDVPWTVAAVDIHPADGQADDPVINTVTVHFHPDGFPNDITATASHELNLFQPSIAFSKTADTTLSKATDTVNYTLALNNTSSADSPALDCKISDALLGLADYPVTLNPNGTWSQTYPYVVKASDSDPLTNTASVSCSPQGFPNVLSKSSSWSVNLFQPSITVEKSGPPLSKIGDDVTYHFKVTNTSSADSPALIKVSISDNVVPNIVPPATCDTLAPGAFCEFDTTWTVAAGSPDPVVNTVTVHYHPDGFTNDITNSASHSLNLFQPGVKITKAGPAYSKAGDTATYNVTILNTSSADAPALILNSFTDSLAGSVTPPAACSPLASGASCSFSYPYTVKVGDPDPLVNTATVHYNPDGFPNDITDSSSYSTDLLHPSFSVTKACKAEPISQAGPAVFTITFNNTGDADLHVVPSEGAAFDVAAGGSYSYDYSMNGPFSTATVNNTVTGNVTLASRYGLSNSYPLTASDSCDVMGKIVVIKNAKPQQGSFDFTTTGAGYNPFTLTGSTAGNGNVNSQELPAGTYTAKESTQLGWLLTGIGGSSDPNTPYSCTVLGGNGSTGSGDLATQTVTVNLHGGDTVTCVFENTGSGVTRTQGFWATHTKLAGPAWFGGTSNTYPTHTFPGVATTAGIGDTLICGRPIDTLGKLMGGFWSSISSLSTGAKRSSLDQARMQLLQQLLAAELNASAFGSVPSGGTGMFAQWESALCGTNTTAIKTAQQQAASFNTQGDSSTFTPGTSADSKYARSIADIKFWDIIKP